MTCQRNVKVENKDSSHQAVPLRDLFSRLPLARGQSSMRQTAGLCCFGSDQTLILYEVLNLASVESRVFS